MTLKDLILKYDFDTIVPDLFTVDKPTIFLNVAVAAYSSCISGSCILMTLNDSINSSGGS